MGEPPLSSWWTEIIDGRGCASFEMIERPANKSSLQHRFIPLWWRNSRMLQPARKMAHTAGGVLCAALKHFSPRTQSHRVRQVEANDGPDQRVQTTNIPGRVVRGMM